MRFLRFASRLSIALLISVCISFAGLAAIEQRQFSDPALEQRYLQLIQELRCLVCQNQNLADSNADLAKDLRTKTADMLEAGQSDREIMAYMSERYGDFVLYRPPFRSDTALLWLGPIFLLIIVIGVLLRRLMQRQHEEILKPAHQSDHAEEVERLKVRNLINNTPPLD